MLVAAALVGFVYYAIDPQSIALRRTKETVDVLAKAKDALIGYAASSATLPGQLPCPDMNNDGVAEPLDVNGNCLTVSGIPQPVIGRLPWKTLGIEDIRDSAGERLWYAPSLIFTRALFTFSCTGTCLDSDTKGALTVSQDKAAAVITNEAVAVIFAPGAVIPGQLRDLANENNSANYVDTWDGVNNASAAGPFISAQASSTFNDRLFIVTTAQLWTVVEQRIARDMLKLLSQYRASSPTNYYPWASPTFDDDSVSGMRRGMAPMEDALPDTWGSLGIIVPAYIIGTKAKWGRLVYYAVAECATQGAPLPPGCSTLTVDGVSKDLVLITPGPADASRPSTTLSDYFKDLENTNNDDQFVTPSSNAYARNRIYTCPGTPGIC